MQKHDFSKPLVSPEEAARRAKRNAIYVVAGLLLVGAAGSCGKKSGGNASPNYDSFDAHVRCEAAMKRMTRDPDFAQIPYIEPRTIADVHYFVWSPDTRVLRLRNGLGLDVAANGRCEIHAKTMKLIKASIEP